MRSFARNPLAALALLAAIAPALAQAPSPSDVVAGTAAELAATIVTRRAELEGNHAAIAALVDTLLLPRFDMQRGTRAILAEQWESSPPADRERFATARHGRDRAFPGRRLPDPVADAVSGQ